ncbi:hypothetical protein CSC43_7056 [Pseudomonas aeruginosa]|nr:hypothetical protein CSC43_7056 [Pseudomonas aeruginosa]
MDGRVEEDHLERLRGLVFQVRKPVPFKPKDVRRRGGPSLPADDAE